MKVVRAHRGTVTSRVTVHGRSAHASDPSLGVNSIEKAVAFHRQAGAAQDRALEGRWTTNWAGR